MKIEIQIFIPARPTVMTEVQIVNYQTKICADKLLLEDSAVARENQDTVNRRLNLKKQFRSAYSCLTPSSVC